MSSCFQPLVLFSMCYKPQHQLSKMIYAALCRVIFSIILFLFFGRRSHNLLCNFFSKHTRSISTALKAEAKVHNPSFYEDLFTLTCFLQLQQKGLRTSPNSNKCSFSHILSSDQNIKGFKTTALWDMTPCSLVANVS
jgi:hypothetical protein